VSDRRRAGRTDLRALAVGVWVAVAVALPAVLIAQIADAVTSGEDPPVIVYPLFVVTLAGLGLGGFVAASKRPDAPLRHGILAALVAFAVMQGIGVVRNLVAGNDIAVVPIAFNATISALLGLVGGLVADRRSATRGWRA
jgi:putative membrane protein (TIGR04086 family)